MYAGYGYYYETSTVTDVNGKDVYYEHENHIHYHVPGIAEYQSTSFDPNGFYTNFDYTSKNIPDTVTVTNVGNIYILNGSIQTEEVGMDVYAEYDNLVIEYDGKNVKSVYGSFSSKMDDKVGDGHIWEQADLITIDGIITGTCDRDTKAEFTTGANQFYAEIVGGFDASEYKGCDVKQTQGRYGGVDVTVYTINGTVKDVEWIDFKLCLYNGYIIKGMGNQLFDPLEDDVAINLNLAIYVTPIPEPVTSGYELLDSDDNIVPGMTIDTDWLAGDNEAAYHETTVVYSVVDGMVEYTNEVKTEYVEVGARTYDLVNFEPNGFYINFDYTGSTVPETVTITKADNTYTLNGKFTTIVDDFNVKTTFKGLAITYVNKEVKAVSGSVDIDATPVKVGSTDRYVESATLEMVGDALSGYGDSFSRYTATVNQDKFYETVIEAYDPTYYKGCDIKKSKTIYEGVEVDVYAIEGGADFYSFKDFEVYTYNGFEIANQGLVATSLHPDFASYEYTVNVYIAELT